MSAGLVHEHLVRLGRLLQAGDRAGSTGLLPVHLHALDYLSRCNRYSDRPLAVAEYLGVTKGTASQSLALLEKRGLIAKSPDSLDRRVVRLRVTARGGRLLRRSGLRPRIEKALASLPQGSGEALARGLEDLLRALQRQAGHRSFGVCHTCRHFRREDGGRFRCGLTREALSAQDSTLICREHDTAA